MKEVSKVIDSENGKIYCYFDGTYKLEKEYSCLATLLQDEDALYRNLLKNGFIVIDTNLYMAIKKIVNSSGLYNPKDYRKEIFILEVFLEFK